LVLVVLNLQAVLPESQPQIRRTNQLKGKDRGGQAIIYTLYMYTENEEKIYITES